MENKNTQEDLLDLKKTLNRIGYIKVAQPLTSIQQEFLGCGGEEEVFATETSSRHFEYQILLTREELIDKIFVQFGDKRDISKVKGVINLESKKFIIPEKATKLEYGKIYCDWFNTISIMRECKIRPEIENPTEVGNAVILTLSIFAVLALIISAIFIF